MRFRNGRIETRESIRLFPYLREKPAIRARDGKKSCEENFPGEVLAIPFPLGARKGDSVERVVVSVRNYESLRRFSRESLRTENKRISAERNDPGGSFTLKPSLRILQK